MSAASSVRVTAASAKAASPAAQDQPLKVGLNATAMAAPTLTPASHSQPLDEKLHPQNLHHHRVYRHLPHSDLQIFPLGNGNGYILQSVDRVTNNVCISWDLSTRNVSCQTNVARSTGNGRSIFGVIGVVKNGMNEYLIVITDHAKVGDLFGSPVYRVTKTDILRLFPSPTSPSSFSSAARSSFPKVDDGDAIFLSMLSAFLHQKTFAGEAELGGLYYSQSYDLTSRRQAQPLSPAKSAASPHEWCDGMFCFNPVSIYEELNPFVTPLIYGLVAIERMHINSRKLDFVLISRRSCFRAGTRYFRRGVDSNGHVANFVETEQLVRGSIPVFWDQVPSMKYTPRIVIPPTDLKSEALRNDAVRKHFEQDIIARYKQPITAVNLTNLDGSEGRLAKAFRAGMRAVNLENIYRDFDFHHHCKGLRFDKIFDLVKSLSSLLNEQKYFLVTNGNSQYEQTGVIRTNCVDCLDRTNVLQAALGRVTFERQLVSMNIIQDGESITSMKDVDKTFRKIWADNADALSHQYSGTNALKTDFTRHGKASLGGRVNDGINSLTRYFQNNYFDGFRQDAVTIYLGLNRHPVRGSASPSDTVNVYFLVVPVFSVLMICATLVVETDYHSFRLFLLLLWLMIAFLSAQWIRQHSDRFVDYPKQDLQHGSPRGKLTSK